MDLDVILLLPKMNPDLAEASEVIGSSGSL